MFSEPQSLLLLLFTKKNSTRFKLRFPYVVFFFYYYSLLKLLAPLKHPQLQIKLVQSSHATVQLRNCHITLLLFCFFCPSVSPDSMYWGGESFRSGPHLCLHCVNTEHMKKSSLPIWWSACWRLLHPQIFWQSCSYKFSHIRLGPVSKVSEDKLKC